jgi:hypothetical protein
MELTMTLSKDDVLEAVRLYLKSKGFKLTHYRFETSAEYQRILFDRRLTSQFEGMTVKVEREVEEK